MVQEAPLSSTAQSPTTVSTPSITLTIRRHPFNSVLTQQIVTELDTELTSTYADLGIHDSHPLMPILPDGPDGPAELHRFNPNTLRDPVGQVAFFLAVTKATPNSEESSDSPEAIVGCVAIRPLSGIPDLPSDRNIAELKRVFVRPAYRRFGVGEALIKAAEIEAKENMNIDLMVLETGFRQTPSIRLYERNGWQRRAAYNPYIGEGVEEGGVSIFFEKLLR